MSHNILHLVKLYAITPDYNTKVMNVNKILLKHDLAFSHMYSHDVKLNKKLLFPMFHVVVAHIIHQST